MNGIRFLLPLLATAALLGCGKKWAAVQEPTVIALASPAVTDAPTPAPSPSFTPLPEPVIEYIADPNKPLPEEGGRIPRGKAYKLGGTVTSDLPLTKVSVFIVCDYSEDQRYPLEQAVTFDPAAGITSYSLDSADTLEGASLDSLVQFSNLTAGHHLMYLFAQTSAQVSPVPLAELRFDVLSDQWDRIRADQFSNGTYSTVSDFFGGEEDRFLYRYQWVDQRYIIADPDWEKANVIDFPMDDGEPWKINVSALTYYEKARQYLRSVSVRVHGTNGDTGVLPLLRCIESYSGSYCSRFTTSKKNISHHAFGTASDINATLAPNENTKDNLALLETEVRDCLAYNGILTENGVSYYDFTYSGSYAATAAGVPETVLNYLLYELAFYRAGFQWGHYYNSTSDGMHFTLTDNLAGRHEGKDRGLRKVYEYCE